MKKSELRGWSRKLEMGELDDPSLRLALELRNRRPVAARPTAGFVLQLREKLLALDVAPRRRPLRWLAPALIGGTIGTLVAVSLLRSQPASAADVFKQANRHYGSLAQEDGVLRAKFTLTYTEIDHVDRSVIRQHEWDGELWQDLASRDFRHQLIDQEGEFHYFAQRHGSQFWRTAYPVIASQGDLVYLMTEDEYTPSDPLEPPGMPPIFGDLIDWLTLDGWWISHATECANPFCAIGLENNDDRWICTEDRCVFPLSSAIGDVPAANVEVTVVGWEQLPDNRAVEVMEIRSGIGEELVRQMKFDRTTYELAEVVAYWMGAEVARIAFESRTVLEREQGPQFSTLPGRLREVVWEGEQPPPHPRLDYAPFPGPPRGSVPAVWLRPIFALPSSGSVLHGDTELSLFVSIPAELQADVDLIAELCGAVPGEDPPRFDPSSCGGLASANTSVASGAITVRLSIQIEPDESWPATVGVMLRWIYPDGQTAGMLDPEFFWTVEH